MACAYAQAVVELAARTDERAYIRTRNDTIRALAWQQDDNLLIALGNAY